MRWEGEEGIGGGAADSRCWGVRTGESGSGPYLNMKLERKVV